MPVFLLVEQVSLGLRIDMAVGPCLLSTAMSLINVGTHQTSRSQELSSHLTEGSLIHQAAVSVIFEFHAGRS